MLCISEEVSMAQLGARSLCMPNVVCSNPAAGLSHTVHPTQPVTSFCIFDCHFANPAIFCLSGLKQQQFSFKVVENSYFIDRFVSYYDLNHLLTHSLNFQTRKHTLQSLFTVICSNTGQQVAPLLRDFTFCAELNLLVLLLRRNPLYLTPDSRVNPSPSALNPI